jgi:hypothetical protein
MSPLFIANALFILSHPAENRQALMVVCLTGDRIDYLANSLVRCGLTLTFWPGDNHGFTIQMGGGPWGGDREAVRVESRAGGFTIAARIAVPITKKPSDNLSDRHVEGLPGRLARLFSRVDVFLILVLLLTPPPRQRMGTNLSVRQERFWRRI